MLRSCTSMCKYSTERKYFRFRGYLKGKSALKIFDKHPELSSQWTKSFWARGYYVSTVGNVTEEAIKRYIQEQQEEAKKDETRK